MKSPFRFVQTPSCKQGADAQGSGAGGGGGGGGTCVYRIFGGIYDIVSQIHVATNCKRKEQVLVKEWVDLCSER